jgi:CBS domain-containing protein
MPTPTATPTPRPAAAPPGEPFQYFYFSELQNLPICAGKVSQRVGRVTDLAFKLVEPYPLAVGIYVEHGGGRPNEFIPWDRVTKIDDDAVFITPAADGLPCPPFADQPGWLLLNEHLMGRTILDVDGRRTEVVNDVHLLFSKGRMVVAHVDVSFNGFLRKWGLRFLVHGDGRLVSWRYVQPLSVEDVGATDTLSLSVTRRQMHELPGEDLADVLETLSGTEQQAVFSALDSEKAAEVLVEAEPRAQRQLLANLRQERARTILSELSVPQIADLFSVLPHDHMTSMIRLLPPEEADRIRRILSDREANAQALMSGEFVALPREARAGDVLRELRARQSARDSIAYVYVVAEKENQLLGVVDLRDLVMAADGATLGELMVSPVVSAEREDVREDLAELFAKYHYRMLPVVDDHDRLLGVVHYRDIMKGLVTRTRP